MRNPVSPPTPGWWRRLTVVVVALLAATAAALVAPTASAATGLAPTARSTTLPPGPLPLGDADLTESRTERQLAPGVSLTTIVRGDTPAAPTEINTTTRGPWIINAVRIDRNARGHLAATYGPDLARTETTSELARQSGALVAVNASFFTFTASAEYPGEPVGLGLFDGRVLSEPLSDPAERNLLLDAATGRVEVDDLAWTGEVRGGGQRLMLDALNTPPAVPAGCAVVDHSGCTAPGQLTRFTAEFGARTVAGPGVEVVLDRRGCVLRPAAARGTALTTGQTSLQATGDEADRLRAATAVPDTCLRLREQLTDADGSRVNPRPSTFGVNGRYQLVDDGEIVVPPGNTSFFARNPRTVAGVTDDRATVLVTIDGRQATSVGTTLDETAAVAAALGLDEAINLDGGGSTAMVAQGQVVNSPSGGVERAVGDALIYVEGPWRRRD